ncbi:GTP pyrophosphokinase [Enterococcus sp. JM4C]|uniref:GTP pyrophosphokinase n=1 Tax=Candidatus Enterococcus huntleyi TaxID=1857217 RepID=UPI00137A6917|nr:GTP pyrophosphokinase [Enterococcus sp. JM4C]KAF1298455.1 GTP pyrophosphokinase [Enterococcus sp. JM4C]
MDFVEIARKISEEAHQGQVDKGGQPYYLHPKTVASFVKTDEEKAVAYLHDVLEDTATDENDLRNVGLPETVIEAVKVLTHQKNEPYFDYLKKVKEKQLARVVKLADLKHNMDTSRMAVLTEKDEQRLAKYRKAQAYLLA